MQKLMTLGIVGAVIALSVGLLSANGFSLMPSSSIGHTYTSEGTPLLGHVTLVVTDPQGQIKEYRQGDNVVVNIGKDCLSARVFGPTSTACASPGTGTYSILAVGTGSAPAAAAHQLTTEVTSPSSMQRATATTNTMVDSSGASAVVTLSKQFTNNAAGTITVTEAGIFNSTTVSGSGMFSGQGFTGIALSQNDALTVTWTLNIG